MCLVSGGAPDQRLAWLPSRTVLHRDWAQTALRLHGRSSVWISQPVSFSLWIIFIWWFYTPTRCIEMGKLHSKHGKVSYSWEKNHSCSCSTGAAILSSNRLIVFPSFFLSFSLAAICKPRESPEGKHTPIYSLICGALNIFIFIYIFSWAFRSVCEQQFPGSVSAH